MKKLVIERGWDRNQIKVNPSAKEGVMRSIKAECDSKPRKPGAADDDRPGSLTVSLTT